MVSALVRSGSTLVIGGTFSSLGGQPRSNLAAVDIATRQVLPWNPEVIGAGDPHRHLVVRSLHLAGSRLYLAGAFHQVGGQPRSNAAAVDLASGSVAAWAPDISSPLTAIRASGNRVYIGGGYQFAVGGVLRSGLAVVDAVTGSVLPLAPDIVFAHNDTLGNNGVLAIAASPGAVYLGGTFVEVNGARRRGAAAVDAATGALLPWAPLATPASIEALELRGDDVFLAGERWYMPEGLATKVDAGTGAEDPAWQPAVGATAFATAVDGDRIAVGGQFSTYHARRVTGLAGFDLATGNAVPVPRVDGPVRAMLAVGNTVFFGGNFTTADEQPRSSLAAFAAPSGAVTAFAPTLIAGIVYVTTLAADGGDLYFGGIFTSVNGQPRASLAAVDIDTGTLRPFAVSFANCFGPDALVARNGRVWVNGTPYDPGGAPLGSPWDRLRVAQALGDALYGERRFVSPFTVGRMNASTGELDDWWLPVDVRYPFVVSSEAIFAQAVGRTELWAFDPVNGQRLPWEHVPALPADRQSAVNVSDGLLVGEDVPFVRSVRTGYFARRGAASGLDAVADAGVHVQGNLVTVRWTPSPSPTSALPEAYRVLVGSRPGEHDLGAAEFPRTSTGFSTLAPSGLYFLRIVPTGNGVAGPPSRELAVAVGVAGCATAPSTAPVASVTPGVSPAIAWSVPEAVNVTGYTLRAGLVSGQHDLGTLTLPATQTTFATAGASPGIYYVVVTATTDCGVPLESNEVQVVVPAPLPPQPPANLAALVSGSAVSLSWTAPPGPVTGYVLEVGSASGLSDLVSGVSLGPAPDLFVAAVPTGRYFVRVRARAGTQLSAPSNEIVVDVP